MQSDLIAILVAVGLIVCFMLFFLALAGGLGFLFFRSARQTARAFSSQPALQGEAFLEAAELRPWSPQAWTDLSSRWEGWWRNVTVIGRHEGYTQGVVKSLQDPAGPGWLAFTLQRQQIRNGVLVLETSSRRVELQVTSQGRLDPNVQVEVRLDRARAGNIAVTYPTCAYRSLGGEVDARWTAEVRNKSTWVLDRVVSRDVAYDPLTVDGRVIALLTDTWIRYPHPQSQKPFHPALQSVADPLTEPEQGVLLIALGMALYYDSLRDRRVIYDW